MEKNFSTSVQLRTILISVCFGVFGLSTPYLIFPALFLLPQYQFLSSSLMEYKEILLGITLAAYPFGQFIGSPILGSMSDEYGRRKLLCGSLLLTSFCSFFSAIAISYNNLFLLIISRLAAGFMEGNLSIARAMAADMKTLDKKISFGKINAAASLAYLTGPIFGGLLSDQSIFDQFSPATPFYLMTVLYLFLSLLPYYQIKERDRLNPSKTRSFYTRINFIARLKELCKNQALKKQLITVSILTLGVDIFYEFGPVYLTATWSYGPRILILYNGILSLALTISSGFLLYRLSLKFTVDSILFFSICSFSLLMLAIVTIKVPIITFFLFGLLGSVIALATTILTVRVSEVSDDTIQGEVKGVETSIRVLGDACILLLGGFLLSFSPSIILALASILGLLSLTYYKYSSL